MSPLFSGVCSACCDPVVGAPLLLGGRGGGLRGRCGGSGFLSPPTPSRVSACRCRPCGPAAWGSHIVSVVESIKILNCSCRTKKSRAVFLEVQTNIMLKEFKLRGSQTPPPHPHVGVGGSWAGPLGDTRATRQGGGCQAEGQEWAPGAQSPRRASASLSSGDPSPPSARRRCLLSVPRAVWSPGPSHRPSSLPLGAISSSDPSGGGRAPRLPPTA